MLNLDAYRAARDWTVPSTMKALILSGTGFDSLAVREVPVPRPGPRQLLARVDAAGVCTSILKILAQGAAHPYFNGWDPARWPVILGDEGSLTLVAIGSELQRQYLVGQRFAIQPAVDLGPINHRERYRDNARGMVKTAVGYTLGGNLAQYLLIQEEVLEGGCLLPLPDDDLPYFAVSMGEPISCVYSAQERQVHILKDTPFSPRLARLGILEGGATVIIGAGPMGLMHAELALRQRPRLLLVCDKIADRLARATRTLGQKAAAAGVQLVTVLPDELKSRLHQLTNGAMADDLILAVGINAVQQQALELLGKGGVANLFGGLPRGQHLLQVDALRIHYDEIKLVGSSGGAPSDLAATLQAIQRGDIDPGHYVFGVGGLQHAPRVLRMIEENRIEGKVILYPHAEIEELMLGLEHWDGGREAELLNQRLRW
jgi:threonine dehydrogenase-like Zn-dependent dehydrogenase